MNPLDQARQAGYSDEEIITHISSKYPEWNDKYQKAKSAGYSDAEILEERYRRRLAQSNLEQSQTQQLQEETNVQQAQVQKPFDEMTNVELQKVGGPFRGTRSGLSAATLGLSENIPGLSVSEEERQAMAAQTGLPTGLGFNIPTSDQTFNFLTDLLPAEGAIKAVANPISKKAATWASSSPYGKKILTTFGRLAGVGAAGAALEGAEEAFAGDLPDPEKMIEHGALWTAIDAGLSTIGFTGRFLKGLLTKAESKGQKSVEVLTDLAENLKGRGIEASNPKKAAKVALEYLEGKEPSKVGQEFLEGRKVEQITESIPNKFREAVELPESINTEKLLQETVNATETKALDSIAKRAETEKALGETVQSKLEEGIEKAKDVYTPLYKAARKEAESIMIEADKAISKIKELKQELNELKTKPAGYQTVVNTLDTALEDLGVFFNKKLQVEVPTGPVPVSKLMELGRRLNQTVDFDVLEPAIKNKVAPVIKTVKETAKEALNSNQAAKKAYELAEDTYKEYAKRFKKENIYKIRGAERPEKIASEITSPTVLEDLKLTLPKKTYSQVERELLEKIKSYEYPKAQKTVREFSKSFSPKAKEVAEEIVNSKNPKSKNVRSKALQRGIKEDLADAIDTGKRPSKTLDLWKTRQGEKVVRDSLKGNPNEKELVKYLNEQSFQDILKTVSDDGAISYSKLNKFVKNPKNKYVLDRFADKPVQDMFKQLELRSAQIRKNLININRIRNQPITQKKKLNTARGEALLKEKELGDDLVKKILNGLGLDRLFELKYLLAGIGVAGNYKTAGTLYVVSKMLNSPRARLALKEASSKSISPEKMAIALKTIDEEIKKEGA